MKKFPLENKTFVFTGELSFERDEARAKVIKYGGKVTTSISSKTTYIVAGVEPGPKKMEQALKLSKQVLSEMDFLNIINTCELNFKDNLEVTSVNTSKVKVKISDGSLWSERYRPKALKELVGNSGLVDQLCDFLKGKTKYKAVLLSGNPGVGKTTTAHLVAKELNFIPIEFNASDVRNKSAISANMKTLNFHTLTRNMSGGTKVIIMDEIDGMSSDRGGLAELNSFIKTSQVYIICICNDRNNPVIRSIANNCLDLRFRKLMTTQILPRLKFILEKEGKQVHDSILNEVILNSNSDIRYCLNTLQNLTLNKSLSHEKTKALIKKNTLKNIFEVASDIMQKRKINEKMNLYFEDYNIIPLFIQENYLKMNYKNVYDIRAASESISYSDVIDRHVHGYNQEWGLLPVHAFFSSILPVANKMLTKRIDFPTYLGNNSKRLKNRRNIAEVIFHAYKHLKMNKSEFRLYCIDILFNKINSLLCKGQIENCIAIFVELDLLKSDYDLMMTIIFDGESLAKNVETKIKAGFTRAFKKLKRNLPYNTQDTKKTANSTEEEEI